LRGYHIGSRKKKTEKKHFAECHEQDTRQKCIFWAPGCRVCRVSGTLHSANREALSSVWASALGKQAVFAECLTVTTLGKVTVTVILSCHLLFFAEGRLDTRQSVCQVLDEKHSANTPLPSKQSSCAVCRVLHSAKPLPSVWGTRQSREIR